jgi:integrase
MRLWLGREKETVHGFRSAFSDWAHERSGVDRHIIEMCLAHTVGSEVERSYRRTDLVEHRRRLLEQWAVFCSTPATEGGEVVPIGVAR